MIIVKIMGGLGNQLFQYATARNISIKKQVPFKVDTNFYNDVRYRGIFRLTHFNTLIEESTNEDIERLTAEPSSSFYARICRKMHLSGKFYKKTHIIENRISNTDKRIINCDGNAYIEGWYQNEKYFGIIRDVLLKEFTLKRDPGTQFQDAKLEISNCESVSIHFRRGDYLTNKFFGAVPLNYYYRAVKIINEKVKQPVYYIFSDDIEWVKNSFKIDATVNYFDPETEKTSIYPTYNDFEEFILMKHCKHNIIANSTFSWWAAWLNTNPGKMVIAPKRWYNDPHAQKRFEKGRLKVPDWIYI
jgi:hypothetical protein